MHGENPEALDELVRRARQGDDQGREQLFAACRDYLGRMAHTQVESWLRAKVDASDLVQQTLFEAHRDFDRFQGATGGELLAWLRRILTHNALDLVRQYHGTAKRQARREIGLRGAGDDSAFIGAAEPASPGPSPSEEVIRRDDQLRVAAALAQLAPDYRDVIVLRNLERLPFDDVARLLGRSRPAAQMLWMRAMKKLQEALGEEVGEE
jgi:RNA polymerase sigma-70 factor (ECF subfamily)